jgi:hypothetical protein
MSDQHDGATPGFYFLARLEIDRDREWFSLHRTSEDAERQLKAVGAAWGVGFNPDGEPADGFRRYRIEEVPVLGPEESGQAPEESSEVTLTDEETRTWMWLIDRGVPGGLSAEEMADDLGITSDVAALRLVSLTALELAYEVSPGRYRPGSKNE